MSSYDHPNTHQCSQTATKVNYKLNTNLLWTRRPLACKESQVLESAQTETHLFPHHLELLVGCICNVIYGTHSIQPHPQGYLIYYRCALVFSGFHPSSRALCSHKEVSFFCWTNATADFSLASSQVSMPELHLSASF